MTTPRTVLLIINCAIIFTTICAASSQQQDNFDNQVCSACFQQLQIKANDEYIKQDKKQNDKKNVKSNEVSRSLILFSIFELIWGMFKPVAEIEPAIIEYSKYITTKKVNVTINIDKKERDKDKKDKRPPKEEPEDCIPTDLLLNLSCEELEAIQQKVRNARPIPEKVKDMIVDLIKELPEITADVKYSTEESSPIKTLLMFPVKVVMLPFRIVGAILGFIGSTLMLYDEIIRRIFVSLGHIIVELFELLKYLFLLAVLVLGPIICGVMCFGEIQKFTAEMNRRSRPCNSL
ncbi:uncharacterized protein [Chironomus tepperi]|uniref:uncharacterized protein n=1 Tax=Chironomus tepperi TaxID=113505 RepID=UPI00391F6793